MLLNTIYFIEMKDKEVGFETYVSIEKSYEDASILSTAPYYTEHEVLYSRNSEQILRFFNETLNIEANSNIPHLVDVSAILELKERIEKVIRLKEALDNQDHLLSKKAFNKQVDTLLPNLGGRFYGQSTYNTFYFNQLEDALDCLNETPFLKEAALKKQANSTGEPDFFVFRASF